MDAQKASALLGFARASREALRGSDAAAAQARLGEAYDDLALAFELFLAERRADDALELATALVPFWMASNRIDEGDQWFERALRVGGANTAVRVRALYEQGYLLFWVGQYERSAELARQAVESARAASVPTVVALALAVQARIALTTDVDEAVRLLDEALAATDGTDDREGRSSALHVLGVAYQMRGDFDAARAVMTDRIALGRQMGNAFLVAVESANLSMVERQVGNLERAAALSREATETFHRLGDELAVAWSANGSAAVTAAQGAHERAATILGFAEAGIERAGGEWPPDERQQYEATVDTLRRSMSAEAFETARDTGRALSTDAAVELIRSG